MFNEVINGLLLSTQQQSGVNMRRPQFAPVTPNIRVGVIPTGRNNSIARSVFQCKCPITAAAQIMLGECDDLYPMTVPVVMITITHFLYIPSVDRL